MQRGDDGQEIIMKQANQRMTMQVTVLIALAMMHLTTIILSSGEMEDLEIVFQHGKTICINFDCIHITKIFYIQKRKEKQQAETKRDGDRGRKRRKGRASKSGKRKD